MALDKDMIRKKYSDFHDFFETESGKHKCCCGCEEQIEIKESHFWNGIPNYIFGHAARLRVGGPAYDAERYYSIEDIARTGKVSKQTARLWARNGRIHPAKTIGRKNLFLKSDIHKFLDNRPHREPFNAEDYVTVQQLKKMGISRSKLRNLVREKKISPPRLHSRKTQYLLSEIELHWDQIQEKKKVRKRRMVSESAFNGIVLRVRQLEERISLLEKSVQSVDLKVADLVFSDSINVNQKK